MQSPSSPDAPDTHPAAHRLQHTLDAQQRHRTAKIKFFVVLGLLLVVTLLSDFLFEASFPIIHFMQHYDYYAVSRFLSHQLFYLPVAYILVLPFISKDKKWAFFRILQASLSNWIFGILKLAHGHWRPNFLDPMLVSSHHHCEIEYGHPSGHSAGAFCFWFIFAQDVTAGITNRRLRTGLQVAIKVTAFFIVMTRLYFGAHALNQIFFGMGLGYLCYLLGEMFDKRACEGLFADMFNREKPRSLFRGPIFWIWAIFNLLGAVFFYYRVTQELTVSGYFDAIVNCVSVKHDSISKFAVRVYENCFSSTIFFWAIFGMQFKPPSSISHLYALQGASPGVFVWRFILNSFPLFLIGKVAKLKLADPPTMIAKQVLLIPLLGYLYGRYYGVWSKRIWLYKDGETDQLKKHH